MGTKKEISDAAKQLSLLGAKKGGRARASVLTPEERSEIARKAVNARWQKAGKIIAINPPEVDSNIIDIGSKKIKGSGDDLPYSMFPGFLRFGDTDYEVHVLNDLRRVITQREVVRILSAGRESGNLTRYLSRNPLINNELASGPTLQFRIPGSGFIATGYEGTHLVEICDAYLEAKDQGVLKRSQFKLVIQAQIVIRACAKVGIIALIDEATGYQKVRADNALRIKVQAFIADDLQEWARMFPEEFWLELARLEGIRYSPRSRPLRWGKYIMMFVYDAIDEDIGKELRKKNPSPRFLRNHHQWLRKFGRDKVHDQIERVITIMKLCDDMDDFRKKFDRVFKKCSPQLSFDWNFMEM
jgi:hypothetical protein